MVNVAGMTERQDPCATSPSTSMIELQTEWTETHHGVTSDDAAVGFARLPDPVGREYCGDFLGFIALIAQRAVAVLQASNLLDVLQARDANQKIIEWGCVHFRRRDFRPGLGENNATSGAIDIRKRRRAATVTLHSYNGAV
jgi:hypothetical protein